MEICSTYTRTIGDVQAQRQLVVTADTDEMGDVGMQVLRHMMQGMDVAWGMPSTENVPGATDAAEESMDA